jgi:hypothetical protein
VTWGSLGEAVTEGEGVAEDEVVTEGEGVAEDEVVTEGEVVADTVVVGDVADAVGVMTLATGVWADLPLSCPWLADNFPLAATSPATATARTAMPRRMIQSG